MTGCAVRMGPPPTEATCRGEATRRVTFGCVHEHVDVSEVCHNHRNGVLEVWCEACYLLGHTCQLRPVAEEEIAG